MRLHLSLSGPDPVALLRATAAAFFPGQTPSALSVDTEDVFVGNDWVGDYTRAVRAVLWARYGDDEISDPWISYDRHVVKLVRPITCAIQAVLEPLATLPFELAVGGTLFVKEWRDVYPGPERFSLPGRHERHGWMCAFK